MRTPRLSLWSSMAGIAVTAFPVAVLACELRSQSLLGLDYCLDMGFATTVPVLVFAIFFIVRKQARPLSFAVGFLLAGSGAMLVFTIASLTAPEIVATPTIYYINDVEPWFMNGDLPSTYSASLLIRGVILAAPQWLAGGLGGLLFYLLGRFRMQGNCRSSPSLTPPDGIERGQVLNA